MNIELLRRIIDAPGISGYEDRVRAVVVQELRPLVDELHADTLGNVIATRKGTGGPKVLIAAHMDEIGFMARHIDQQGFIRIQQIGSFDPRVLLAQRVIVHTEDGERYPGVIETTSEPLHFGPPGSSWRPSLGDLFIDLGLSAAEVHRHIEIGNMITMDRSLIVTKEALISKALDNRLGLYIMIEALRAMGPSTAEIIAVATTQEEVGSRGAVTAAYALEPGICIALDLTIANDIPSSTSEQEVTRLGSGPAIKVMDTTQLSHPKLVRHLRDIARQHQIPYQLEVLNRGGTDASLIQRTRAGVTVCTLSIPARYIHTVNEMASQQDVESAVMLLARYLEDAGNRSYQITI